MEELDLTKLEDYEEGMYIKHKRGAVFVIDFVGNYEISITNIKNGQEKEVAIDKIVKDYTIIKYRE